MGFFEIALFVYSSLCKWEGGGGELVEMQQQVNMFLQLCSCDDIVGCYNNRYEQVYPRLKCKSKVK